MIEFRESIPNFSSYSVYERSVSSSNSIVLSKIIAAGNISSYESLLTRLMRSVARLSGVFADIYDTVVKNERKFNVPHRYASPF